MKIVISITIRLKKKEENRSLGAAGSVTQDQKQV